MSAEVGRILVRLFVVFSPLLWYDMCMRNVMGKAKSICCMVAGGKSVLAACRRVRVSRATFYRWTTSRPEVAKLYQQACQDRLSEVDRDLSFVGEEIQRIRSSVPPVRPRDGVSFKVFLKAIRNPYTPAAILERMHPRTSRHEYQKKRREMQKRVESWVKWQGELKLEKARLLGKLKRGGAMPC